MEMMKEERNTEKGVEHKQEEQKKVSAPPSNPTKCSPLQQDSRPSGFLQSFQQCMTKTPFSLH